MAILVVSRLRIRIARSLAVGLRTLWLHQKISSDFYHLVIYDPTLKEMFIVIFILLKFHFLFPSPYKAETTK